MSQGPEGQPARSSAPPHGAGGPTGFGIHRIAWIGIQPGSPGDVQRRVAVSNLFAATIALVTLPWSVIFTLLGQPRLGAGAFAVCVLAAAATVWNALGKHVVARLWLLAWSNLAIFAYALALGLESGIHLLFMATTCSPLALFDAREHRGPFIAGVMMPVALGAAAQRMGQADALRRSCR